MPVTVMQYGWSIVELSIDPPFDIVLKLRLSAGSFQ